MTWRPELSETLTAMVEGASPQHPSLVVEEVEIKAPMLVRLEHGAEGPRFVAHPPHSIWRSGFEPVAHSMTLRIAAADDEMETEEETDTGHRNGLWD